MRTDQGVALVASLLIMVAIMSLGVGSLFLTDMNLKIAENARSSTIAKYHADAGVDTAVALLTSSYHDTNKFPATFTLPVTAGQSYRLLPGSDGYRRDGDDQVRVRVEGFTDSGARYVAEVLLATTDALNPAFAVGAASMGRVEVRGGSAEFVNAGLHGNKGLRLPGYSTDSFRSCDANAAFSSCAAVYPSLGPLPVSSSNGADCYLNPHCDNRAAEVQLEVAYLCERNDTVAAALGLVKQGDCDSHGKATYKDANTAQAVDIDPATNPSVYTGRCTTVYGDASPPPAEIVAAVPGAVICVKDGGSINFSAGIEMRGVTVIADGDITFGGARDGTRDGVAGKLSEVTLIAGTAPDAPDGAVMLDSVSGHNLTLFSGANRDRDTIASSPHYLVSPGFRLSGVTTIASSSDVVFAGETGLTKAAGRPDTVTVAVISAKTISHRGASDFYGVFWAGTGFENGPAKIHGAVASAGDITATGTFRLNSSYALDNPYLYGPAEPVVVSRR
jgi:hypothetical protein